MKNGYIDENRKDSIYGIDVSKYTGFGEAIAETIDFIEGIKSTHFILEEDKILQIKEQLFDLNAIAEEMIKENKSIIDEAEEYRYTNPSAYNSQVSEAENTISQINNRFMMLVKSYGYEYPLIDETRRMK